MGSNVWVMKATISTEIMLSATGSSISESVSEISMKVAEQFFLFVILNTQISAKDKGGKTSAYI